MEDNTPLAIIILAAGKGSRMRSAKPKVMHKVAGRPMINWLIETAECLAPERIIVVTAPNMDDVQDAVAPHQCMIQKQQNGTGDAVKPAAEALKDFDGQVLILMGDEPFVDMGVLETMIDHDGLSVMAIKEEDPAGLGRVITHDDGYLSHIVEDKDCTEQERKINLCNAGNYCLPAKHLSKWLGKLSNDNAQSEYYLTDLPKIAEEDGFKTAVIEGQSICRWGVNTRLELAEHEYAAQSILRQQAMEAGVSMVDPATVYLSWDTEFGEDVVIAPNVVIGPLTCIEDNVTIHAFSHIEGAIIEQNAEIGPFARIRPKSVIGKAASVGNFTEVNRSTLKEGAKAKHVSYIGDAIIGEKTNIGAGTIIANYDGFLKHQTIIGDGVFVGSNSTILAPVTVGDKAILAANSTINKNVPGNAMAIARTRQENHEGWASQYRSMKRVQKKQQEDD